MKNDYVYHHSIGTLKPQILVNSVIFHLERCEKYQNEGFFMYIMNLMQIIVAHNKLEKILL